MPLARHDDFMNNVIKIKYSFYSHASCEAWRVLIVVLCMLHKFLLTCLLRGMTEYATSNYTACGFYSHASCEAWRYSGGCIPSHSAFLLTCLLRGMTASGFLSKNIPMFLLTCLLRGMTGPGIMFPAFNNSFYSHASCEAWHGWPHHGIGGWKFLLTCLLRGMTRINEFTNKTLEFLLTCLLRGMTVPQLLRNGFPFVSTHMPLARHDISRWHVMRTRKVSTHMPLARHDICRLNIYLLRMVSTHMPLARHDLKPLITTTTPGFLLTCLLRGMTLGLAVGLCQICVSTHMPLARHDRNILCFLCNHATIYKRQTF